MNPISKTQIDRLGDRLRKGKFGDEELRGLDEFRRSFAVAYEEVVSTVRKATQLEPTGRPAKSTTSIVEKLRRETMRLTQMQDIAGCRLVVQDVLQQDKVVAQLTAALPSAEVVDRRKQPSHGYRAVHIIAWEQGKPVEIQVRTELQHLWAQLSEKLSDVLDPAIKYGGGDSGTRTLMALASRGTGNLEFVERELREQGRLARRLSPEVQQRCVELAKKLAFLKQDFREFLEGLTARFEGTAREPGKD